jgi:hypothetical protein
VKKLITIALVCLSVAGVAAASSLAASGNKSVIYDSTMPNGAPTNQVSYGPAAYSFQSIGDKITFAPSTQRSLSNVTLTLSSWACQQGTWYDHNCVTQPGATFPQTITLSVYKVNGDGKMGDQIATSTGTFDVPFRPSASSKCAGTDAGKWQAPSKECKNGITDDVTFPFSGQKLDESVIYQVSYTPAGPSNSLNVAMTSNAASVGTSADSDLWIDGQQNSGFDGGYATTNQLTPSVQFKANNAS